LKKTFSFLLRIIVALGLLIYVISTLGFENVLKIISKVSLKNFIIFLLITFSLNLLAIFRWWILLRTLGLKISFFKTLKYAWIGVFFNNIFPSTIGGDFIKAYYIYKDTEKKKEATISSVILDRTFGGGGLLIITSISGIVLFNRFKIIAVIVLSALFLYLLFLILIFQKNFLKKIFPFKNFPGKNFLRELYYGLYHYKKKPQIIILALLISVLVQTIFVFLNYKIALSITDNIRFLNFYLLIPIASFLSSLPITIGGWGLGEFVYKEILSLIPITPAIAVSISLIFRINFTLFNLVGLPFYIFYKGKKIKIENL